MTSAIRQQLLAERAFLRERLTALPDTARLTRGSLESRLREVEDELGQMPQQGPAKSRARLTFNGKPVEGNRGIVADFGTKAVSKFVDAVAAVAASLTAPLAAMGPIPGRDQYQLLITGTALGSFGFELEERGNGGLQFDGPTPVEAAIERTQDLLRSSAVADDEALADAAVGLDRRALDKVRHFVSALADDEAVCALQFGDRVFRFSDAGQVRRSMDRLSADNLVEDVQVIEGRFEGVLPTRRTFEFRVGGGDVLAGKIDRAIADPESINSHLNQPTKVRLLMTKAGAGRPRYVLIAAPQWMEGDGDRVVGRLPE